MISETQKCLLLVYSVTEPRLSPHSCMDFHGGPHFSVKNSDSGVYLSIRTGQDANIKCRLCCVGVMSHKTEFFFVFLCMYPFTSEKLKDDSNCFDIGKDSLLSVPKATWF